MTISVRIVSIDHYMATPGPLDRAYTPFTDQKLSRVPVLRIFGSTEAGQKACVHIHQVYPYFYVPYSIPAECTTEEEIQKHIFQFGTSLNEAMNVARPKADKNQHVAAIVLIKGVPFYGYHVGYQTFLKIYLTNPSEKLQMLDVLQSRALENTHFQPHEAHLNFELQFLIDHNLYGMDWLHIEEQGLDPLSASFGIKFRLPLLDEPKSSYAKTSQSLTSDNSLTDPTLFKATRPVHYEGSIYTSKTVPLQLQSDVVPQESYCELELDITGMAILNRHELQERNIHTTLKREKEFQRQSLARMNDESKERLVKSLQVIWRDEVSRRRARGVREPIPPVTQIEERAEHVPWSVENDLRRLMENMMTHITFDETSESQQSSTLIPQLMTLFQSVEALYPEEYFQYRQQQKQQRQEVSVPAVVQNQSVTQHSTVDSDVNAIGKHTENHLPSTPMLQQHTDQLSASMMRTTPEQHRTPVSNQFNVSATPSRYRTWGIHSQVDKSLLQSFIADRMSTEDGNHSDGIADERNQEENEEQNEDAHATDGSDDFYSLANSQELVLEEAERNQSTARPAPVIEYDEEDDKTVYSYRPRKLNLIEEAKKIDSTRSERTQKSFKDLFGDDDDEDEDEEVDEDKQFDISDIPPDPRPHVTKKQKLNRTIDQVDGVSDKKEGRGPKRLKTAAERWEEERRFLKRMRTRRTAAQKTHKFKNVKHAASAPPENRPCSKPESLESTTARRRVKSTSDIHPKGFQKVTVVIPLHSRRRNIKAVENEAAGEILPIQQPEMVSSALDAVDSCEFLTQPCEIHNKVAVADDAVADILPGTTLCPYSNNRIDDENICASNSHNHSQRSGENNDHESTKSKDSQSCQNLASRKNFISRIDALWSSSEEEKFVQTTRSTPEKPILASPTQQSLLKETTSIPPVVISQIESSVEAKNTTPPNEGTAELDPITHFFSSSSSMDSTVIYDFESSVSQTKEESAGKEARSKIAAKQLDAESTLYASTAMKETSSETASQQSSSSLTYRSSASSLKMRSEEFETQQQPSERPSSSGSNDAASSSSTARQKLEKYGLQGDNYLYDFDETEDQGPSVSSRDLPVSNTFHEDSTPQEFVYNRHPPILGDKDIPRSGIVYQEPFYSKASDIPRFPPVFAGKEFKLTTNGVESLKEFVTVFGDEEEKNYSFLRHSTRIKAWQPSQDPPTLKEVQAWIETKLQNEKFIQDKNSNTQLEQPTADNTYNFKFSASKPQAKVKRIRDYIDFFSLEIHVNTREKLLPDPKLDPVQLIFWCLQTEDLHIPSNGYQEGYFVGLIALKEFDMARIGINQARNHIDYANDEEELFNILIDKIRFYDPDMLVGYEVSNSSWGYLVDRGAELGIHLLDELSRVKMSSGSINRDTWGYQKASVYRVVGRHMLNVWRLMQSELTMTSYTFENVAYHLLHDRIPHYSYETLTSWYVKGAPVLKYRLVKYYLKRVQLNLDMLDASQVVQRTSESARVYGIDFYAVLTRGSQYDVESVLFRIAKPENFALITPSRKQVAEQRSLEILPLIMEPVSQFYSSPMVVLDFQSLYPSIMIAYNFCYSTCLGRIRNTDQESRFGVLPSFELPDGLLDTLKEYINVTPNGIMFVKPEIRKSTLAKMLEDLLDTRVMIKRAMKDYKEDSGLLRLLDAKQLTLKLLANVTYGYTSASFSGRMPSVEIADSIVATGRETLERAIRLINETEKWGARVVYGDTDSLFIYFPGKTGQEAFVLGKEIADTVTRLNPAPVKLKFEKVYHPAVLLAKKRYVGYKYEDPRDEPVFEAKGIETVRRDGTAATQKIMESCLKILFRTQDMSQLKEYLYKEWTKILSNRVILQDFIIAKEVRMGTYRTEGPNGAIIAQAQMKADARAEPQYGERVPYVVIYRGPNARLKDKVVRPEQLLNDSRGSLRLDAEYYIRKQIIPPLSRIFNLMGVDILSWYESMPRHVKAEAMNLAAQHQFNTTASQKRNALSRIDQYYASSHCVICRKLTDQPICKQCKEDPVRTTLTMLTRQKLTQTKLRSVLQTCQNCSKLSALDAMTVMPLPQTLKATSSTKDIVMPPSKVPMADIPCDSLDCPIFYERLKAKQDVKMAMNYDILLNELHSK